MMKSTTRWRDQPQTPFRAETLSDYVVLMTVGLCKKWSAGAYKVMLWCFSWLLAASSAKRASLDDTRLRSSSKPSLPSSISLRPLRTCIIHASDMLVLHMAQCTELFMRIPCKLGALLWYFARLLYTWWCCCRPTQT